MTQGVAPAAPRRGAASAPERGPSGPRELAPVWEVLAAVGAALTAAAVVPVLQSWLLPPPTGPDRTFVALVDVAAAVPLLVLGLGGLLAAAVARRRRRLALGVGVACVALGLVLFLSLVAFAGTAPAALQGVEAQSPGAGAGVRWVIARTFWALAVGLAGSVAAAAAAFRFRRDAVP